MIFVRDFKSHYFLQLDVQDRDMYLMQILQCKCFTVMDASLRNFISCCYEKRTTTENAFRQVTFHSRTKKPITPL